MREWSERVTFIANHNMKNWNNVLGVTRNDTSHVTRTQTTCDSMLLSYLERRVSLVACAASGCCLVILVIVWFLLARCLDRCALLHVLVPLQLHTLPVGCNQWRRVGGRVHNCRIVMRAADALVSVILRILYTTVTHQLLAVHFFPLPTAQGKWMGKENKWAEAEHECT